MRKGFNFYRSYFEVSMELKDSEFIDFIKAILQKQFNGIEPTNLKGMAKFAYLSQKHSIDSQVKGYEDKTKSKLEPMQGGSEGGAIGGSVQEKEKEKVQISNKVIKLPFQETEIFDKAIFKSEFSEWNNTKLAYYYNAALAYSNEGNKYVNWKSAINSWAKRDELQGKLKFEQGIDTKNKTIIY
ncbi:MAG: DUF6291 domain-containing protein [Flavobacterium sp.]|uniref:DUF6291 domain-containing protein n=1 Tax=Flavobacterium sp. TaxID=239 RepID=UPI003BE77C5A